MSDNYQAVYDAVRSRISTADIGSAVESAMRDAQLSFFAERAAESIRMAAATYEEAAAKYAAPSAIYRPTLSIDGNQWCALYGENLQDGVAGFGDTPAAACADFDKNWCSEKAGNVCVPAPKESP